jgi:hypothetical protein
MLMLVSQVRISEGVFKPAERYLHPSGSPPQFVPNSKSSLEPAGSLDNLAILKLGILGNFNARSEA